jgi:hypothetical protein
MIKDEFTLLILRLFYYIISLTVLKDLNIAINFQVEANFLICWSFFKIMGDNIEVVLY